MFYEQTLCSTLPKPYDPIGEGRTLKQLVIKDINMSMLISIFSWN